MKLPRITLHVPQLVKAGGGQCWVSELWLVILKTVAFWDTGGHLALPLAPDHSNLRDPADLLLLWYRGDSVSDACSQN